MKTLVLVPGTGGHTEWTAPGSPLRVFLIERGYRCVQFLGWSGDVDGVPQFGENGTHADWISGGWALSYLLQAISYEDRNIIAHSHGGQVAAYACARTGIAVRSLVTVSTPVRKDMGETYAAAKPHIGYWRHVYATGWDFWQRAGELFDGHVGWSRTMPDANENVGVKDVSHSKLLTEEALFPRFAELIVCPT
jgi:pimeloyl-ACP methyl ester carboxylesterase